MNTRYCSMNTVIDSILLQTNEVSKDMFFCLVMYFRIYYNIYCFSLWNLLLYYTVDKEQFTAIVSAIIRLIWGAISVLRIHLVTLMIWREKRKACQLCLACVCLCVCVSLSLSLLSLSLPLCLFLSLLSLSLFLSLSLSLCVCMRRVCGGAV